MAWLPVEIQLCILLGSARRVSPVLAAADAYTVPIEGFGTLSGFEASDVNVDIDHDNAPIR